MARLLGIDCGGSLTRAMLVSDGKAIWSGSGGPANLSSSPAALSRDSLASALDGCPQPDAVCGAFAGLLTDAQRNDAVAMLSSFFPSAKVTAVTDFEAALQACGVGTDVCVLAGTGSLVCSMNGGKVVSSGGRGYLLGDEGSAFQYGRDALLHYLDAPPDDLSDGLRKAVEDAFGSPKKPEIISALYAADDAPKRVASLSEAFAADGQVGAIYALKSLRIHPGKLAHVVAIHLRTYHPDLKSVRIGCQGGLWSHAVYRDAFTNQLAFWCKVDEIDVDYDPPAPVYGAAQIAGKLLGN